MTMANRVLMVADDYRKADGAGERGSSFDEKPQAV